MYKTNPNHHRGRLYIGRSPRALFVSYCLLLEGGGGWVHSGLAEGGRGRTSRCESLIWILPIPAKNSAPKPRHTPVGDVSCVLGKCSVRREASAAHTVILNH